MEWLMAIVVGLVVGALAGGLFASEKASGFGDMVVGVLGGLLGKWILSSVWIVGSYIVGSNFNLYSVLWAALGSLLAVGVWRVAANSMETPTSLPR